MFDAYKVIFYEKTKLWPLLYKNFLIYSEVINEDIYCHGKRNVSSFLIRILCEILYIAPNNKI